MQEQIFKIKEKAKYCLNCKNKPCKLGCPLQNNIPDFIKNIKEDNYEEAFKILSETTIFETICGRICPHKSQCEGNCIRKIKGESVSIGELEAYVGDYALNNIENKIHNEKKNKKVAIIGSGPSGLACAYYLSTRGYDITIYEKHSKLGGLLRYGIPQFRLDKDLLDKWLDKYILNKNTKVINNVELGRNVQLQDLKKEYDYIVLAFGANVSNKMNIVGENLEFVLGGNELLEYQTVKDFKNKNVAVIGGGNVAMDSARTIKKLGADKVSIVYRRSEKEMPAENKEIQAAKDEGIEFLFQTNILKVLEEKKIEGIKTKLVKKDGEVREYPVDIEGTNFLMNIDFIVLAVGSKTNQDIIDKLKLETSKWGYIKVDEDYKTSDEKVYAVGDLIGTKQTVAWAARSGFNAAKNIEKVNF